MTLYLKRSVGFHWKPNYCFRNMAWTWLRWRVWVDIHLMTKCVMYLKTAFKTQLLPVYKQRKKEPSFIYSWDRQTQTKIESFPYANLKPLSIDYSGRWEKNLEMLYPKTIIHLKWMILGTWLSDLPVSQGTFAKRSSTTCLCLLISTKKYSESHLSKFVIKVTDKNTTESCSWIVMLTSWKK